MSETEPRPALRTVIVGDSVIYGLGCRERTPYGRQVAAALGDTDPLDLTAPSRLVRDVVGSEPPLLPAGGADLAVVGVGCAECLVFPGAGVQWLLEHLAPAGWHGVAGLAPRARYSADPRRARRQRLEARLKRLLKQALVTLTGAGPRVPVSELEAHVEQLLEALAEVGTPVALVGLGDVDSAQFPRVREHLLAADRALARLGRRPGVCYVPVRNRLEPADYLPDGLHLSAAGHDRVAALVLDALRDAPAGTFPTGATLRLRTALDRTAGRPGGAPPGTGGGGSAPAARS